MATRYTLAARSHAAQGYEPQVKRTAAIAVALSLGSGS